MNTTTPPGSGLDASAKFSLIDVLLYGAQGHEDVTANSRAKAWQLDLRPYLDNGVVLVKLELTDAAGEVVSSRLYWLGDRAARYRDLTRLAPAAMKASATRNVC